LLPRVDRRVVSLSGVSNELTAASASAAAAATVEVDALPFDALVLPLPPLSLLPLPDFVVLVTVDRVPGVVSSFFRAGLGVVAVAVVVAVVVAGVVEVVKTALLTLLLPLLPRRPPLPLRRDVAGVDDDDDDDDDDGDGVAATADDDGVDGDCDG
jgi:hypothetical protein